MKDGGGDGAAPAKACSMEWKYGDPGVEANS